MSIVLVIIAPILQLPTGLHVHDPLLVANHCFCKYYNYLIHYLIKGFFS